jgi:hypothetical protein
MSTAIPTPVDAVAAPREDGGLLIWPPVEDWPRHLDENRRLWRRDDARLLGEPLRHWRSDNTNAPTILTGHQPSFFHAGVWIKSAATLDFAGRCGGLGAFLVVDCDVSHGVTLARPRKVAELYTVHESVAMPAARGLAFEQLPPWAGDPWREFFADSATYSDAAARFASSFVSAAPSSLDYLPRWLQAMRILDESCCVNGLQYLPVSRRFDEHATAAAFAAHLLLCADQVAVAYNAALTDLHRTADAIELPFWLMRGSSPRQRLFVARHTDRLELLAGSTRVAALDACRLATDPPAVLRESLGDWRLRPRALALTMYARLLEGDWFIHGIGGAKYDQITDDVIRRLFGIEPPRYACVSATLRLPLNTCDTDESSVHELQRRIRDARFNPHRALERGLDGPAAMRRQRAIAESDRLRAQDPGNRAARRRAFETIRQANAELLGGDSGILRALHQRLEAARRQLASNHVARNREWFFALHSLDRLTALRASMHRSIRV